MPTPVRTARSVRGLPLSRWARTAAAVGTAIGTAVAGHVLSTGVVPSAAGLLLAVAVLAPPAWLLTGSERGWERLAAAQLVAQLASHALFAAGTAEPGSHASGHGLVVLAHVLAAAVAGAWLRCGERRALELSRRALAALGALVTALLGRAGRAAPATTSARLRPQAAVGVRRPVLLRHAIVHRGPPAAC